MRKGVKINYMKMRKQAKLGLQSPFFQRTCTKYTKTKTIVKQ